MNGMRCVRFVVVGRVQGVGFRYFTAKVARDLGLTGFVRNVEDGTVQGEAQGSEAELESFLARLEEGPRAARVDILHREQAEAVASRDEFQIRRS